MIASRRPIEKCVCRAKRAMAQGRQVGWVLWTYQDADPATGDWIPLLAAERLRQIRIQRDRQRFKLAIMVIKCGNSGYVGRYTEICLDLARCVRTARR